MLAHIGIIQLEAREAEIEGLRNLADIQRYEFRDLEQSLIGERTWNESALRNGATQEEVLNLRDLAVLVCLNYVVFSIAMQVDVESALGIHLCQRNALWIGNRFFPQLIEEPRFGKSQRL